MRDRSSFFTFFQGGTLACPTPEASKKRLAHTVQTRKNKVQSPEEKKQQQKVQSPEKKQQLKSAEGPEKKEKKRKQQQ